MLLGDDPTCRIEFLPTTVSNFHSTSDQTSSFESAAHYFRSRMRVDQCVPEIDAAVEAIGTAVNRIESNRPNGATFVIDDVGLFQLWEMSM